MTDLYETNLWIKGLILGFSIAAPVGPIGVLCIRRTLADGRLVGFVSGLGAATADAMYGAIAAFGLALVTNLLVGQQFWLRLVGGLFLCYLGVRTFFAAPAEKPASASAQGLAGAYASTFFLTLSNPMTILSFTAVFAGLGLGTTNGEKGSGLLLVFGVFCGSALWWFLLSGTMSLFRYRVQPAAFMWINRVSGLIIFGFGILSLASLLGT